MLRALVVGTIGSTVALPAHAEPTGSELDGLRLPDRPVIAAPALPSLGPDGPAPGAVTVESGDSLWRIAAAHLPPDATAARIAEATGRWHEGNRAVIGDDPDLVRPGQLLTPPQEDPS